MIAVSEKSHLTLRGSVSVPSTSNKQRVESSLDTMLKNCVESMETFTTLLNKIIKINIYISIKKESICTAPPL